MIGNVVQGLSEMAEENSEFEKMSNAVAEQLSLDVRRACEPCEPDEHINQRIRRSARRLRVPESVAKRLWYREMRRIPADLYLSIRDRANEIADEQLRKTRLRLDALEAKRRAHERSKAAVADLFECRYGVDG